MYVLLFLCSVARTLWPEMHPGTFYDILLVRLNQRKTDRQVDFVVESRMDTLERVWRGFLVMG